MRACDSRALLLYSQVLFPIDRSPTVAVGGVPMQRSPFLCTHVMHPRFDLLSSQLAQTSPLHCLYRNKDKSPGDENVRAKAMCLLLLRARQDVGRKDWVGREIASLSVRDR